MTRPYDITLAGYVGADPAVGQDPNQTDYARFRLACTPTKRTENGWEELETIWYSVKAWGRLGRAVKANVRRGMGLVITGQPRLERWTDVQGQEHQDFCIYLSRVAIDLTAGNYIWFRACDDKGNYIVHSISGAEKTDRDLTKSAGSETVPDPWQVDRPEMATLQQSDPVKALADAAAGKGEYALSEENQSDMGALG